MKNIEKIKLLKKEGFAISHATFYRHIKNALYSKDSDLKEIRKILKRIEKLKNSKFIENLANQKTTKKT